MGFFNALKNIALGRPVFETAQAPNATGKSAPVNTGPKVIPALYIERTNCHTSDDDMEVEVTVQNYSQEELHLDKLELLGQTKYLSAKQISPGEEDELEAYSGDRPDNSYRSDCLLYYKNAAGDYFCSVHNVEYQKLPDNTYAVRDIRFMHVRDV